MIYNLFLDSTEAHKIRCISILSMVSVSRIVDITDELLSFDIKSELFFYQPRSGRSTVDVGQKKRGKRKKTLTLAFYCHFCLCAWNIFNWSHYMGVYGLAWTPAFIFETIWTPGPNFGSKGPLAPNFKIAIFSQNLTIWVSMDLPGPQH